jgi:uncharacterized protein YjiS (DUF1127 family)
MSDGILSFSNFISAAFRTAGVLARAWLRVRRWIARRRPRQTLAGLDDWILRDIGVIRERDMGTGLEADPREAARQFWRP